MTLRFRVRGPGWSAEKLADELSLRPFVDLPTPVVCDDPRVEVSGARGGFREVALCCHGADELATPAFDAFLGRALASYLGPDDSSNGNGRAADPWAAAKSRVGKVAASEGKPKAKAVKKAKPRSR